VRARPTLTARGGGGREREALAVRIRAAAAAAAAAAAIPAAPADCLPPTAVCAPPPVSVHVGQLRAGQPPQIGHQRLPHRTRQLLQRRLPPQTAAADCLPIVYRSTVAAAVAEDLVAVQVHHHRPRVGLSLPGGADWLYRPSILAVINWCFDCKTTW
jgi:hypothetical protein